MFYLVAPEHAQPLGFSPEHPPASPPAPMGAAPGHRGTAVPSTTAVPRARRAADGRTQHSSALTPFSIHLLPLPPAPATAEDILVQGLQGAHRSPQLGVAPSLGPSLVPTLRSSGRGARRDHDPLRRPSGEATRCPNPPFPSYKSCPDCQQALEADFILISFS